MFTSADEPREMSPKWSTRSIDSLVNSPGSVTNDIGSSPWVPVEEGAVDQGSHQAAKVDT